MTETQRDTLAKVQESGPRERQIGVAVPSDLDREIRAFADSIGWSKTITVNACLIAGLSVLSENE